jgi:hypothetical protein
MMPNVNKSYLINPVILLNKHFLNINLLLLTSNKHHQFLVDEYQEDHSYMYHNILKQNDNVNLEDEMDEYDYEGSDFPMKFIFIKQNLFNKKMLQENRIVLVDILELFHVHQQLHSYHP